MAELVTVTLTNAFKNIILLPEEQSGDDNSGQKTKNMTRLHNKECELCILLITRILTLQKSVKHWIHTLVKQVNIESEFDFIVIND